MGGLDLSRTLRHRGLENGNFRLNLTSGTCVRLTGLYLFTLILLQLYLLRLQTRLSFDRLQTCLRKGKKNLQKKSVACLVLINKTSNSCKKHFQKTSLILTALSQAVVLFGHQGSLFCCKSFSTKVRKDFVKTKTYNLYKPLN